MNPRSDIDFCRSVRIWAVLPLILAGLSWTAAPLAAAENNVGAMSSGDGGSASDPDDSSDDCFNGDPCECQEDCDEATGICTWEAVGEGCVNPGVSYTTKDDCISSNFSRVNLERSEYIHDAIDYQWQGLPKPSAGCAPCGAQRPSAFDARTQRHRLIVSRAHNFRSITKRASFGLGVFSPWDRYLTIGISGTSIISATLYEPAKTRSYQNFNLIRSPGIFGCKTGQFGDLRILDANGAVTNVKTAAVRAEIALFGGGGRMVFEIVRSASNVYEARLSQLIDSRGLVVQSYAYAIDRAIVSPDVFRLATASDAMGTVATFAYDSVSGYISSIAMSSGETMAYTYAASRHLAGITYADGTQATFSNDTTTLPNGKPQMVFTVDDPMAGDRHRRVKVWLTSNGLEAGPDTLQREENGAGETVFHSWYDQSSASAPASGQYWTLFYVYRGGNQLRRIQLQTVRGIMEESFATNFTYGVTPFWQVAWKPHIVNQISDTVPNGITHAMDLTGREHQETYLGNLRLPTRKSYPDGTSETWDYDAQLRWFRHTDRRGMITERTFDAVGGELLSVKRAVGLPEETEERWEFHQDGVAAGLLSAAIDARGNRTDYAYDAQGRLASITAPADVAGGTRPVTSFVYDAQGRVQQVVLPSATTQSYSYDGLGRLLRTSYSDASAEEQVYGTGADANLVVMRRDRNGNETRLVYDGVARVVSEQTGSVDANQVFTALRKRTVTYLAGTLLPLTETVDGETTVCTYDHRNRLVAKQVKARAASGLTQSTTYDDVDHVLTTTDAFGRSTAYLREEGGRVVREVREWVPGALGLGDAVATWKAANPSTAVLGAWTGQDINNALPAGSASVVGNGADAVYTIAGGGADMWGAADGFYSYARSTTGDVQVTARVLSQTNADDNQTNGWSRAGVMLRADNTPGSPYIQLAVSPKHGLHINCRRFSGGFTEYLQISGVPYDPVTYPTLPSWLRIERAGRVFTMKTSKDGGVWTTWAMVQLGVGVQQSMLAGLVVHSNDASQLQASVATFDNVDVTPRDFTPTYAQAVRWLISPARLVRPAPGTVNPAYAVQDFAYDAPGHLVTATDALGNRTSHTYDLLGRLVQTISGDGSAAATLRSFAYDSAGNRIRQGVRYASAPASSEDVTATTYTNRNLVATVAEAVGTASEVLVSATTYTLSGKPSATTDALGRTTTYQYGTCCDRLVGVTDPLGFQTTFTYDKKGNRLTVTDAALNTTTTSYDALDRVVKVTNPLGKTVLFAFDENLTDGVGLQNDALIKARIAGLGLGAGADGRLVRRTDENGKFWYEVYDGLGRSILAVDPLGNPSSRGYDAMVSGLVESTHTDGNGSTVRQRQNGAGLVVQSVDALGNVSTRSFDGNGNLLSERDPQAIGRDMAYDARNRLLTVRETRQPTLAITTRTYDAEDRVLTDKDAANKTETSTYDARGRKTASVDRIAARTDFTYDNQGNLLSITDADARAKIAAQGLTGAAADALRTQYRYDERNLLTHETFPTGTTGRTRRVYTYDGSRRLATRLVGVADPASATGFLAGQPVETTTYTYDKASRLTKRAYSDGTNDTFAYDAVGRLTSATASRSAITVTRVYDVAGRLSTETTKITGGTPASGTVLADASYAVKYTYDKANRVTKVTYPDNRVQDRGYSVRNELTSVGFPGVSATRTYDASGHLTTQTDGNQKVETRTYVANSHLVSSIAVPGVTGFSYQYDSLGRKTRETSSVVAADTQQFGYDAGSRLTSWKQGPVATPAHQQSWALSLVGDWKSTTLDGVSETRTHQDVHEVATVNGAALSYDRKGNLTVDAPQGGNPGQTYAWDFENRLMSAANLSATQWGGATYAYDALGRRIRKSVDGKTTTFIHDGARVIYEIDSAATPTKTASTQDGTLANLALTPLGLGGSGAFLPGATQTATKAGVIRVNFQPISSPDAPGYLADRGRAYAKRTSNALTYGWSADRTGAARQRNKVSLPQYDTLIETGTAAWEIALPNGTYPVVVVAGDAANVDQTNDFQIEGLSVTDPDPSTPGASYAAGDFDAWAVLATVTDGKLTILASASAVNPKLCFLEIGLAGSPLPTDIQDRIDTAIAAMNTQTAGSAFPLGLGDVRAFVHGTYVDDVVAFVSTASGTTASHYVHNNHLYSVAALTDTAGQVVEQYSYTAYGKQTVIGSTGVIRERSAVGFDRGFTGYVADQETGLLHARERMYDGRSGRFYARDPIGHAEVPRSGDGYLDGYGLYCAYFVPWGVDPSGMVGDCEIEIYIQHYGETDQEREIMKQYPDGKLPPYCRIGAVACWGADWNKELEKKFPGHVLGGGSAKKIGDSPDSGGASLSDIDKWVKEKIEQAREEAKKMCKDKKCKKKCDSIYIGVKCTQGPEDQPTLSAQAYINQQLKRAKDAGNRAKNKNPIDPCDGHYNTSVDCN